MMRRTLLTLSLVATSFVIGSPSVGAAAPPRVLFTDVLSGPVVGGPAGLGVPISIYGTGFGASRGASSVRIGGVPVAKYLVWGKGTVHNRVLDMIVIQPGTKVKGGAIVVTVGGRSSPASAPNSFVPNRGRILAISRNGSDAAACTLAAPCATISEVMTNRTRPGDTVLVRGGAYAESEVWIRGEYGDSGTAAQRITVKAYPGERVILTNAARPFIVDADYVTVAGLEFTNGKPLGIPDTGLPGHRGDRFIDNRFTGRIDCGAIDTHGNDHVLAGNVCQANGSTVGTQGHCFYVSYGDGVQLRYNVASGAPGYGIHVFDQQRSTGDFRRTITNLLVEGNRLSGSTERSGLILAMGDEGAKGNVISGITIRGNRIWGNNHLGIVIGPNVRNVVIAANDIGVNGRQGIYVSDDATIDNVRIIANTLRQTTNTYCRSDCSWYPLAHAQVGPRARRVAVAFNRYLPSPPVLLGTTDPTPR